MSGEASTLLQQALNLAPDERYEVAQLLLDSLGEGEMPDDPEFQAELDRRLESIADGTAELIDGEDLFKQLREQRKRMDSA